MQVRPEQLAEHLAGQLRPVYLICGEEQLLVLEAAERVRQAATMAGFTDRLVFEADGTFDWAQLQAEAAAMSLFSQRRVLDVRLDSGKPGKQGGEILTRLASHNHGDLLLLSTGRLDRRSQNTSWFKALASAGVVVQCWPISAQDLPRWLARRMADKGLGVAPAAVRAFAERVEGNLLAAVQEVEKLHLLHPGDRIDVAAIEQLVADSARFDIFELVDAMLAGEAHRAVRIARGLRAEDAPLPVIAWALTKEVRLLCRIRYELARGGNLQQLLREAGVWESRTGLLQRAMRRMSTALWQLALNDCAALDRLVKGQEIGDPWIAIERLVVFVALAGHRIAA